jgi:hypothetical protein
MTRSVVRAALALPARSTASNGRRPGSRSRHGLAHHRSVAAAPSNPAFVTLRLAAGAMVTALSLLAPLALPAQTGVGLGGTVTPYAGYLVTGDWYQGPVGTSISAANTPMVGAQLAIPLVAGLSLTGNLGYASSSVQVGVPLLGDINMGDYSLWVYDAGLELGGLPRGGKGLAPFVQAGIGGMTNNAQASILQVQATNLMYTAGVGVDVGLSSNFGLRLQAKDYIGRFDSQEAIGIANRGTLSHSWALSAGLKLAF